MAETVDTILDQVADYYSAKLAKHGETSRGVDWNGPESQSLRFAQLSRVFRTAEDFSVNDIGCGYGAYVDYLDGKFSRVSYSGFDIAENMVEAARKRLDREGRRFVVASAPDLTADYSVASGIFNVRLECPDEPWLQFILDTLDVMDRSSRLGFAFNCLTSYSDVDKMRDYLYYADPCALFDHCKQKFSRNVALLHDYDLYEFTIIVRKNPLAEQGIRKPNE